MNYKECKRCGRPVMDKLLNKDGLCTVCRLDISEEDKRANEQYLKNIVKKFNWQHVATIYQDSKVYVDEEEITITVNLKTGDFNFEFLVPESNVSLCLDQRSVFYIAVRFNELYEQITNMAKVLKKSNFVDTKWLKRGIK